MKIVDRLKHAWNVFINEDKTPIYHPNSFIDYGYSSTYRPDRVGFSRGNERSIVTSVYNRIAIDCASKPLKHVRLDEEYRFKEILKTDLNYCLTVEANKDQHARAFIQDVVMSLFDEGVVAIVPVDTTTDINKSNVIDIQSMRTGKITNWYPDHVRVEVYNDKIGQKREVIVPKKNTVIIENPFYAVMNEPNSVLQRLISKLNILDAIDKQSGSGKLDLIIQLPYVIKSDARRAQADKRKADIESQLENSKFGIAYTDGTEKVTQLNRPIENNLLKQIEYLTSMLFAQLNITVKILDGTADEKTMLNYHNRTIEPILASIALEIERKFLTKTARTQGQAIKYFNEPFRLVPLANLADIADKFTRNEILSSNEVRQMIGFKPVNSPEADELRNKNLNKTGEDQTTTDEGSTNLEDTNTEFRVVFKPEVGEKDAVFKASSKEEVESMLLEVGFALEEVESITQI